MNSSSSLLNFDCYTPPSFCLPSVFDICPLVPSSFLLSVCASVKQLQAATTNLRRRHVPGAAESHRWLQLGTQETLALLDKICVVELNDIHLHHRTSGRQRRHVRPYLSKKWHGHGAGWKVLMPRSDDELIPPCLQDRLLLHSSRAGRCPSRRTHTCSSASMLTLYAYPLSNATCYEPHFMFPASLCKRIAPDTINLRSSLLHVAYD